MLRLLLELVDEMVKNSLPEWMTREAQAAEETGTCRDYDDFFSRTRYTVPEGVLTEDGRMEAFTLRPQRVYILCMLLATVGVPAMCFAFSS